MNEKLSNSMVAPKLPLLGGGKNLLMNKVNLQIREVVCREHHLDLQIKQNTTLAGKPLTRFCKPHTSATKSVSPVGRDGLRRVAFTLAEGGRSPSRHPELVSGSIPVADCNSREVALTGQTNIDRFRNKFGMTKSRQAAFTLAEVLITLGIIGVVAAITLPTLIHKYQAKVLKSYFQKSYAATSNAIMTAKANVGVGNFGEYCTYYNGSEYVNQQQCYDAFYEALQLNTKSMKVTGNKYYDIQRSGKIKTYNNKEVQFGTIGIGPEGGVLKQVVRNKDGSYAQMNINGSRFYIGIDTNGAKGPNRLGHDIFEFQVDKKNDSLSPVKQSKAYTDEEVASYDPYPGALTGYYQSVYGNPCNKNSNQALNGIGCSWFAVNDINPETGEKGYWENLPK